MTDASSTVHKVYLVRNPWGTTNYSGTWNKDDANWTQALKDQVPYGVDIDLAESHGIFVAPVDAFMDGDTACFGDYQIAHYRESESYANVWYDVLDDAYGLTAKDFYFTTPDSTSDLYVTVESYYQMMQPAECVGDVGYVDMKLELFEPSGSRFGIQYYWEQYHRPILVSNTEGLSGDWNVKVTSDFYDAPGNDYTVMLYSTHDIDIMDEDGQTSVFHTDGSEPSEFTDSCFTGQAYDPTTDDCSADRSGNTEEEEEEEETTEEEVVPENAW